VEGDVAVGELVVSVVGVVDALVVMRAEQDSVFDGGGSTAVPGVFVVGVAPGGGDGAALGSAASVADAECFALCCGVESSGASEVEGVALAAEDDGDDAGLAGETAGVVGSDGGVAVSGERVVDHGGAEV
jgi:hypothetical protein